MNNLLTDKETNDLINKLNTCYHQFSQWEIKKAQKKHIDIFGIEINEGDFYYRLRLDVNFSNDIKLSNFSMDKFLYVIFTPYPNWEKEAEKVIIEKQKKIHQLVDKLFKPNKP